MAHPRQLIRDEMVSILNAGLNAILGYLPNVFNARIISIEDVLLPAVAVRYTETEGGEEITSPEQRPGDNNLQERELNISVDVVTQEPTGKAAADKADDISNAVEDLIQKNITLNKKCDSIELRRVRFRSEDGGEKPIRSVENIFEVSYLTNKAGA